MDNDDWSIILLPLAYFSVSFNFPAFFIHWRKLYRTKPKIYSGVIHFVYLIRYFSSNKPQQYLHWICVLKPIYSNELLPYICIAFILFRYTYRLLRCRRRRCLPLSYVCFCLLILITWKPRAMTTWNMKAIRKKWNWIMYVCSQFD